jgi:DNA-binding response OmpR family regulator
MADTAKRKVLIVEDNIEQAELEARFLPNFDTEIAGSREEGLRRLLSLGPKNVSAILLDLKLPNGQGKAVVVAFQTAFPAVPIVVVTGLNEVDVDRTELILAGAQEIIRKPFSPEELNDAVVLAVVRHEVRRAFAPVDKQIEQIAEKKCDGAPA